MWILGHHEQLCHKFPLQLGNVMSPLSLIYELMENMKNAPFVPSLCPDHSALICTGFIITVSN